LRRPGCDELLRGVLDPEDNDGIINLIAACLAGGSDALLPGGLLGDFFFNFAFVSPVDVMRWRVSSAAHRQAIGVHIRGGDFRQWDPSALLPVSYYEEAVHWCLATAPEAEVSIFTDDHSLDTVYELKHRLGTRCRIRPRASALVDLRLLSESQFIVASPSTFAIWAGILGPQSRSIHCREWVERKANQGEYFWRAVASGGSEHYRVAQLV